MTESFLIKFSLVLSIIGIIILFLISGKVKIKEYPINKLSKEILNEEVKVSGKVQDLKQSKGMTLISLKDKTGLIKVVLRDAEKIKLKNGQNIEVTGKFKTYQKEFEIEANEIKIL